MPYHARWQPGKDGIAAAGGADRRSAKNADRPLNQSREAHLAERSLHSPEGGHRYAPTRGDRTGARNVAGTDAGHTGS